MGLRLIVSPAKKLVPCEDFAPAAQPLFLAQACQLTQALRALGPAGLQGLWRTSDALTQGCLAQLARWNPDSPDAAPAVMSYRGIQYQSLAPQVLDRPALEYLDEHLRILSGLYGWLRPFDAVVPYRLEMQARLAVAGCRNLYDFWGDLLAGQAAAELGAAGAPTVAAGADRSVRSDADGADAVLVGVGGAPGAPAGAADPQEAVLVNLASQEYAKAVVPRLPSGVRVVTCLFGQMSQGRLVQRATQAKAARGSFVRWCAEHQVTCAEDLAGFDVGYRLDEQASSPDRLVFLCQPGDGRRG